MTTRASVHPDKRSKAASKGGRSFFFKKDKSAATDREHDRFFSPSLAIGKPNDKFEKEADTMANHVVSSMNRSSSLPVQAKCAKCEEEQKKVQTKMDEEEAVQLKNIEEEEERVQKKANPEEEEKEVQLKSKDDREDEMLQKKEIAEPEESLRRKSADANQRLPDQSLESQLNSRKGEGSGLSQSTRKEMEHSFGADFRDVNIHTGSTAIQMAEDLHAQAFTHGSDIYFNRGKYDPSSSAGKHLLAHELTHVVQQDSGVKKKCIQRQLAFGSGYAGLAGSNDY